MSNNGKSFHVVSGSLNKLTFDGRVAVSTDAEVETIEFLPECSCSSQNWNATHGQPSFRRIVVDKTHDIQLGIG